MARAHNIDIKSYLPADLPPVALDRELFKQALLNLMLNAQEAMTGADGKLPDGAAGQGGELTIQATPEPGGVCLSLGRRTDACTEPQESVSCRYSDSRRKA